ncbi:MAG: CDP-alcohol phosphatidyltransferase family protein [Candidatus Saccharibacteria bacterium]
MPTKRSFNVQKTIDDLIDKVFLRYIPNTVRPNQITTVRFVLIPIIYWFLAQNDVGIALIIFIIAASTDFIDGAMARTRHQITDLGKVIDPIADKLLIMTALLYIGIEYTLIKIFIVYIIFELFAVLIGYFFSFAIGKPIGANVFGKIKLILQCLSIGIFMLGVLLSDGSMISVSMYILFVALFFAIMAGIETARRKVRNYLNSHDIDVIYS